MGDAGLTGVFVVPTGVRGKSGGRPQAGRLPLRTLSASGRVLGVQGWPRRRWIQENWAGRFSQAHSPWEEEGQVGSDLLNGHREHKENQLRRRDAVGVRPPSDFCLRGAPSELWRREHTWLLSNRGGGSL